MGTPTIRARLHAKQDVSDVAHEVDDEQPHRHSVTPWLAIPQPYRGESACHAYGGEKGRGQRGPMRSNASRAFGLSRHMGSRGLPGTSRETNDVKLMTVAEAEEDCESRDAPGALVISIAHALRPHVREIRILRHPATQSPNDGRV